MSVLDPKKSDLEDEEVLFQRHAIAVLNSLFILVKLARVHKMSNKAVLPAINRFIDDLEGYQIDISPEVAIQLVGDAVYVSKRLVRADVSTWEKTKFLKAFFARMDVSEITFTEDADGAAVREFLQGVRDVTQDAKKVEEVKERRFPGISFRKLDVKSSAKRSAVVMPDKLRVLRAYGLVVVTLRDVLDQLRAGERVMLLPVRRAIQDFVRLPRHTTALQLGLLSLTKYRGELAGRLANVGVMVMLMSRRMGFRIGEIRDMGTAAALAQIGRAGRKDLHFCEPDAVAGADAFHKGLGWLAPYSGRGRGVTLRVIVASEMSHPESRRGGHPLTRLVAVADRYETLTQRKPLGAGMRADLALHQLLNTADLDQRACKLLVRTLGMFPVGSTVRLSTGETAIVMDVSDDPRFIKEPRVMLVSDAHGNPLDRTPLTLAGSGRHIVGTVEADALDLNVGHFLFA